MPKKRFSAEQIVTLLRQIEVAMGQGKSTQIACRDAGISTPSATGIQPVHIAARSDHSNAIISLSRWYKKSVRPTPGLDLRIAFGRVRDEVLTATKNKQEPFVYGSLGGTNISIVDAAAASVASIPPPTQAPVPSVDRAERAWAVTKDTTSIAILEDFIRQFGGTPYGSMARARLKELQAATTKPPDKVAVTVPSVPAVPEDGPKGPYGAIAYSPSSGTFGSAVQHVNRPTAEQRAMRECGKSDCEIAAWFFNGCGALAKSDNGSWGAEYNNSEQRARVLAQARCVKEGGTNCQIVFSLCSR